VPRYLSLPVELQLLFSSTCVAGARPLEPGRHPSGVGLWTTVAFELRESFSIEANVSRSHLRVSVSVVTPWPGPFLFRVLVMLEW
jgi:hypothetical protein